MSSFTPHATHLAPPPEYEGIQLDAFFFVPTVVGLPAKTRQITDDDDCGFSLLELTTI